MALIQVDRGKCEKEGFCVEVCPARILEMDEEKGPQVTPGGAPFCIGCGHCVAVCPHGALDNVRNFLKDQEPLEKLPVVEPETAMAFLRSRRSIRCYLPEPLPRDEVIRLLQAARYAPSGHNSQGLSYLVVQGDGPLNRMKEIVVEWMRGVILHNPEVARQFRMEAIVGACERGEDLILRGAPQVVVATGRKEARPAQASTFLALEYVELYAAALGLGTCWGGYVMACAQQSPALSRHLGIPEDRAITGVLMIGRPRYAYRRVPARDPLDVEWLREEE